MAPSTLSKTIIIYALFVAMFVAYQPKAVFQDDGSPTPLGLGAGKTLFHVQTMMIFFSLLAVVVQRNFSNV